jgi:ferredoxin-NADP reductase
VKSFEVRLIECELCGTDTLTCRFERPTGYGFLPGQYAVLTLETTEGAVGKPFSLAAAPGDPYLEVTTRLSGSAFKRELRKLEPGASVRVSAAAGRLVLPQEVARVTFLVGGVGITPARSVLRDAMQQSSGLSALLVYGSRDESCIVYREELEQMRPHGIRVAHVLEAPRDDWRGHRGFITADTIRSLTDPGDPELYVVAGPPAMVDAMDSCLDALGVPASRRMVERFSGYR